MRDSNTPVVTELANDAATPPVANAGHGLQADFALARQFLPVHLASLQQAAPQVLAWRDAERLLYLQAGRDIAASLQLMQWHRSSGMQQELLGPSQWRALLSSIWQLDDAQGSLDLQRLIHRLECVVDAGGNYLYLQLAGQAFCIGLETGVVQQVAALPLRQATHGFALSAPAAGLSLLCPQGRYLLKVEQHNLLLQEVASGAQVFLTADGQAEAAYGCGLYFGGQVQTDGSVAQPLIASFSPDGRYLLSYKLDYRDCHRRQMLRLQADGSEQIVSWPEVMTGQEDGVPVAQLVLFDVELKQAVPLHGPQFAMLDFDYCHQFFLQQISWADNCLYLLNWQRGRRSVSLYRTDLSSGETVLCHHESSDTLLHYPLLPASCVCHNGQLFWLSAKDGWNHIYLLENGSERQLTQGEWAVQQILACDAAGEYVYFVAGGKEHGVDPYYRHLYRLHLASGCVQLLTPEEADHAVMLAPDCSYFVDSFARHDLPAQVVLRNCAGQWLQTLGAADFSQLQKQGWRAPQAFVAKARHGQTDLYGLLALPPQMQQGAAEGQRFPVVISIYPGCHTATVPKRLQLLENHAWFMQSIAALGFIVVRVDGMGGPGRSKAFHDVCHRNLADATLPDQIAVLQQLAQRHPQFDLSRVAIIGSSAGGYAAARALLTFPAVFKLGVAAAGNHDLLFEGAEWTEDYGGWPVDRDLLQAQSNSGLARQLQGRLLLVHGMQDDNVSVAQSLRLGQSLVANQKQVDMLILPQGDHAVLQQADVQEFVWRYLVRHLG